MFVLITVCVDQSEKVDNVPNHFKPQDKMFEGMCETRSPLKKIAKKSKAYIFDIGTSQSSTSLPQRNV